MTYSIITCAKKDSSRLPGKNLLPLNGKPLIDYTLDFMVENFDIRLKNTWVITDSMDIIRRASSRGINQIMEPEKYAINGHKNGMELMRFIHGIINSDVYCLLPPTSPVRVSPIILGAINDFMNNDYMSGVTVYRENRETWKINGSLFMWRKEQLQHSDIIGPYPRLYEDIYNFDINTEYDFEEVEAYLERKME